MKTASLLFWENILNVETNKNWSDAFGTLNADVKSLVTLYTASGVALDAINYDPASFSPLRVGEFKADMMTTNMAKALKILSDKSKQAWAVAVT